MAERERFSVLVDGKEFSHFSEIEIHEAIDAVSTVRLVAPFEASRREFRDIFRPFTFRPIQVNLNGARLFTGTLVGVNPSIDANERAVELTGYALAGALNDCTMPGDKYPIEFKNLGLGAIARQVCAPFGLSVQVRDNEGAPFTKVRLEEDRKILDFIGDLARQRNLVWANTPDGMPLCWRSIETGNPVVHFEAGVPPFTSIEAEFAPQEYFSEVTCFSKATRRKRGSQYTEKNKWLTGVLRPLAFKLEDTDPAQAPDATRAKLGRMFGNMASFTVDHLPTMRDPAGNIWAANKTLTVYAPDVMIYRKTELLIREIILKQTKAEDTADLKLCLPGAFSGKIPDHLPWEE